MKDESAAEVVQILKQIFADFGPPKEILTDNGTVFRSRQFVELLNDWAVKHLLSCSYRAQGNAVIERVHRTIKRTIKRCGNSVCDATF